MEHLPWLGLNAPRLHWARLGGFNISTKSLKWLTSTSNLQTFLSTNILSRKLAVRSSQIFLHSHPLTCRHIFQTILSPNISLNLQLMSTLWAFCCSDLLQVFNKSNSLNSKSASIFLIEKTILPLYWENLTVSIHPLSSFFFILYHFRVWWEGGELLARF